MLIVAALALSVVIPIEAPRNLPGWTPAAPEYGPRLVQLLQLAAEHDRESYARLTERERKCWWATQLYEAIWADFHATALRLAVQPPDPTGPGAAISRHEVSEAWLRERQRRLRKEWERYTELMGDFCPGGGGHSQGYRDFDAASGDWLWGELDPYEPERAGLLDSRMVVPSKGWTPDTLIRATLELRKRGQTPRDGLTCGC